MHGCPTGCTIEQPVVKGFDNRLYRINGVLVSSGQHWNKTFSRLDAFPNAQPEWSNCWSRKDYTAASKEVATQLQLVHSDSGNNFGRTQHNYI